MLARLILLRFAGEQSALSLLNIRIASKWLPCRPYASSNI